MSDMYTVNQAALHNEHSHILQAFDAALGTSDLDFGTAAAPGRFHAEVFINGDTRSVKVRDRVERCSVTVYRTADSCWFLCDGSASELSDNHQLAMEKAAKRLFDACRTAESAA